MKRTILHLAISLIASSLFGQIELEHKYDNSSITTLLNATDYKYYSMDDVNNQCKIYNLDHSIYKTIDLVIPNNNYLYDVRFVTQDLFDADSKIEVLYVYYQYIVTDAANDEGYYKYYTRVVNEDGDVLISVDGGLYSSIYTIGDDNYRLFIYSYDYSSWPYATETYVYKLPGYPYLLSAKNVNSKSAIIGEAYPNPAAAYVTIPYSLPENVNEANLKLMNMRGQQVANYRVDRNYQTLNLHAGALQPGQYLYQIEADGMTSQSKELLVK